MPASLSEIGRSLRQARQQAELTVGEAAGRAWLPNQVIEALESANVTQQHDRIGTLRALRTYADSLGLPGRDYVLVAVEQWPSVGPPLVTSSETAVVPVVSISSAPAGGHAPVGGLGALRLTDATGVAEVTTTGVDGAHATGVMDLPRPAGPFDTGRLPALDTGRVRALNTGQVPAVNLGVPRLLTFMIGLVSVLIVLGGAALAENTHLDGWFHSGRRTTTRWINEAKSALGITTKSSSGHAHATSTTTAPHPHKVSQVAHVTLTAAPGGAGENVAVTAHSFTVNVVAAGAACWLSASPSAGAKPIFEQDLLSGETHSFVVDGSLTIETGSSAGRAFFYEGTKLIGYYFPAHAPFTMNLSAIG